MMIASRTAAHWTAHFPDVAAQTSDPALDAFRLCAAMWGDGPGDHPLAQVLAQIAAGLGRAPEIGAPGASDRSFDEAWLLALIAARRTADVTGYTFLLRARLSPDVAAEVHFGLQQALIWLDDRG
jgi:hypothetical protein